MILHVLCLLVGCTRGSAHHKGCGGKCQCDFLDCFHKFLFCFGRASPLPVTSVVMPTGKNWLVVNKMFMYKCIKNESITLFDFCNNVFFVHFVQHLYIISYNYRLFICLFMSIGVFLALEYIGYGLVYYIHVEPERPVLYVVYVALYAAFHIFQFLGLAAESCHLAPACNARLYIVAYHVLVYQL